MARPAQDGAGRRAPVHSHAVIDLRGDAFRLVAVADTHGSPHAALEQRLRELGPDHVLHAGDVGDTAVLDLLRRYAPVTAVRGNVDGRGLPDLVILELRAGGASLLRILLTHVAVYGPKLRADVRHVAQAEEAGLVVCGHSHVPLATSEGGIAVFNPGSVGPRRFHLPILLGVIDVSASGVSLRHVDCETGRAWTPRDAPPPRY